MGIRSFLQALRKDEPGVDDVHVASTDQGKPAKKPSKGKTTPEGSPKKGDLVEVKSDAMITNAPWTS